MKYIVVSDIHIGHVNTPTEHIIDNFKKYVLTNTNADASVLFINGDLFDRLLDLKDSKLKNILMFFKYLCSWCYTNNVYLRVLEGTPSHDWEQSSRLVDINNMLTHRANLVYHKNLEIEYIDILDKYVLYIPDEWTNSNELLEKQINKKLNNLRISNVDMAMLHGQFNYQVVGTNYKGFRYEESYFLKLVTGYIHIGHYHTYSYMDRIIANGSFDRLCHGEEEAKGYVVVNDSTYNFIVNPSSYIYKTITLRKNYTLTKIDSLIHKYPKGSHIRILLNRDNPYNTTFKELRLRYLDYHLKKLVKEDISESSIGTHILTDGEMKFDIDYVISTSLHDALIELIQSKYSFNDAQMQMLKSYTASLK